MNADEEAPQNPRSRREIAFHLRQLLTAKAGYAELAAEPDSTPEDVEADTLESERAASALRDVVVEGLASGALTDDEAAVILGPDYRAAAALILAAERVSVAKDQSPVVDLR